MNSTIRTWLILGSLVSATAFAQSSARFSITRGVIAGGGATFSSSARFQLGSTIGQPIAALPAVSHFSIRDGFWIWPAPQILMPTHVGNDFTLSFQTELGKTYLVQYIDFLVSANWQSLPVVTGDNTIKTVTNSAPGINQRYFRILEQ